LGDILDLPPGEAWPGVPVQGEADRVENLEKAGERPGVAIVWLVHGEDAALQWRSQVDWFPAAVRMQHELDLTQGDP